MKRFTSEKEKPAEIIEENRNTGKFTYLSENPIVCNSIYLTLFCFIFIAFFFLKKKYALFFPRFFDHFTHSSYTCFTFIMYWITHIY
ncbi:hypothetical protein BDF14DRAFT_1836903 [Spinellus fusiger]|nr:hypothetical protein BDF14DRAFT_1836903 [Spinellus fusiger]